jgi:hypothetical protein
MQSIARTYILLCFVNVAAVNCVFANPNRDSSNRAYNKALEEIKLMLFTNHPSFERAVFLTENAYFDDTLSFDQFNYKIQMLAFWAKEQAKSLILKSYTNSDSEQVKKNMAIYQVLKDTCKIHISEKEVTYHFPFAYDFSDYSANKRWTSMFVTKLLVTEKGNCHSLPYVYKILADALDANCWLSFAPYHIYIKNHCQGIGWYNTELTSGQFPVDGWIMASGYVSGDAVRSGIYMDTLSNQEAVANCAIDLAKGYERKFQIYTDSFIIKCCDLTLKYHSNNINAIIYKAETLKKMYLIYKTANPVLASTIYSDMEQLYVHALDLGYKEMPEAMYKEWLTGISKQKEKYSNKEAVNALKGK